MDFTLPSSSPLPPPLPNSAPLKPEASSLAPSPLASVAQLHCYHCNEALVGAPPCWSLLGGASRAFCCAGCQMVAETIHAGGLENFYAHRSDIDPASQVWSEEDLAATRVYDEPGMLARFVREIPAKDGGENLYEVTLVMENIRCAACVWLNEQHLERQAGVVEAHVNYATRRAIVRWQPSRIQLSDILLAMAAIGYRAWPYARSQVAELAKKERLSLLMRMGVAMLGMMQVMMYAFPVYWHEGEIAPDHIQLMRWASFILTVPVMAYSAWPMLSGAWRDVKNRHLGMDVPVALGISAAFLASAWATWVGYGEVYFDSLTMFVALLLGARYLELRARQDAVSGAEELARQVPASCQYLPRYPHAEEVVTLPVANVEVGYFLRVRAGEVVPVDGEIVSGQTEVEEALLTGESRPIAKQVGDVLLAGSHNCTSAVVLRVTQVGERTRLAEIVRLLDRALEDKPRIAQLADQVAVWFVAALLVLVGVTGVAWYWLDPSRILPIMVAVLVVSCPCALSLATPAALAVAHGALAKLGLLVTRGHSLETLAQVTDVLLDKTGTLTEGHFALVRTEMLATPSWVGDAGAALRLAQALERDSEHPIGKALLQAGEGGATQAALSAVQNTPGQGVAGQLRLAEGSELALRLGRLAFVQALSPEKALETMASAEDVAHTAIYLGSSQGLLARFVLGDTLRSEARDLLASLRAQGKQVHLISGDASATVAWWAQQLGISAYQGDVSPEGKKAYVEQLQRAGKVVLAVGDGINDAPVLAAAQVSIAIGSGAPLAQAGADAVLAHGRIKEIAAALGFSQKVRRVVKQNLTWAFAYNVVAIPLAACGFVSPWLAGVGMSLSSLLVVANAWRLRKV